MTTIHRPGNAFSDSPLGPNGERLSTAIRAITGSTSRRKPTASLPPAGDPPAIEAERRTAARDQSGQSGSGGGGLAWDFEEQQYTGTSYLTHTDSTGLFVVERPENVPYVDGNGLAGNVKGRLP